MARSRRTRSKHKRRISPFCRKRLSEKIRKNMHEKRYKSRAQAIAVAYAMTRKKYPRCSRSLRRRK